MHAALDIYGGPVQPYKILELNLAILSSSDNRPRVGSFRGERSMLALGRRTPDLPHSRTKVFWSLLRITSRPMIHPE